MNDIHRLVYCSRNEIQGSSAEVIDEIHKILLSARVNNAREGISGALLFNEGLFAQVLEGPLKSVERIFEKIQQDPRHSDVIVLQCEPTPSRSFAAWSMAFAGVSAGSPLAFAVPVFDSAYSGNSAAGKEVLQLLHSVVVQEDCLLAG
jgi:blue light- and temperature-responsive anti-repressor